YIYFERYTINAWLISVSEALIIDILATVFARPSRVADGKIAK
ncbi:MAG: hypothetical protein RI997_460, partial [Pseudomonadota bacterium]